MTMADSTVKVHLLRHGEVYNPEGVLYGRLPGYHLSDRGRQMATQVARYLVDSGIEVTQLVSSPLTRAQETSQPISEAYGLEVITDDRVIEAANHFEGLKFGVGDGALKQPKHWSHLRNPFRPSWGEPYQQQVDRVLAAVSSARARESGRLPGSNIVIVSHQLPIWVTRQWLSGKKLWHDPRKRECSLASLTTLTYVQGSLRSIDYSEPAASLLPKKSGPSGA